MWLSCINYRTELNYTYSHIRILYLHFYVRFGINIIVCLWDVINLKARQQYMYLSIYGISFPSQKQLIFENPFE